MNNEDWLCIILDCQFFHHFKGSPLLFGLHHFLWEVRSFLLLFAYCFQGCFCIFGFQFDLCGMPFCGVVFIFLWSSLSFLGLLVFKIPTFVKFQAILSLGFFLASFTIGFFVGTTITDILTAWLFLRSQFIPHPNPPPAFLPPAVLQFE